ncbi:hypothetical protein BGZ96_001145 [Linnemannia gamsii]|uniref:Uncharacterized protein n=1 Tax=Linnemannia gamsii TaxID=64522 RepID=A0ABQ7JMQ7_9FUNG|nr:hypothetical protein BGZ96_001145 [Linnemannia gamsii]
MPVAPFPGTPRRAAGALPDLTGVHSSPAASISSQFILEFNVAEEFLAVNVAKPSIRAFIESDEYGDKIESFIACYNKAGEDWTETKVLDKSQEEQRKALQNTDEYSN